MQRFIRFALIVAGAVVLSACGALHSARMWFPGASGMDRVTPTLFVEPLMSADQRTALRGQIEVGRARVEAFYGSITTAPCLLACVTAGCAERFGS